MDARRWRAGRLTSDLPDVPGALVLLGAALAAIALAARYQAVPLLAGGVVLGLCVAAAARWPSLLLYVYAASIPLNFVVPPGPGGTVARVLGIVFVVGYLVRRLHVLRLDAVPPVLWALLGWSLASCLWAIDPEVAFSGWLSLAQLAAVAVLIASIVSADPAEVGRVMWAYSTSAVMTALIAVVTYLQDPAIFVTRAAAFEAQDPAQFASALIPAVIFLTHSITSADVPPLGRIVSAASTLACVAAVALSGTRSAWLALVAAALVWGVFRPSRRLALGFATVALALGALTLLLPGASTFLLDRAGSATDSGGAGRTDIWAVGYAIFTSAPVVGVGFGNFPVAFTQVAIDTAPVSVLGAEDLVVGQGPHNALLEALVETGLIGAALLVAAMLTILRRTGRAGWGPVVQVTLAALLIQALLLDIRLQKQLWLVMAFGIGLAAAERRGIRVSRDAAPVPSVDPSVQGR